MTKFSLGEMVQFDDTVGFIVGISIDPYDSADVAEKLLCCTIYTVRVFADFYPNGCYDFQRTEEDLRRI